MVSRTIMLISLLLALCSFATEGYSSTEFFVVPHNPEYLGVALKDEGNPRPRQVNFSVEVQGATSLSMEPRGLGLPIWNYRGGFQLKPLIMMTQVVNALVANQTDNKTADSRKMVIKLVHFAYTGSEYGIAKLQPTVWLEIEAKLYDGGEFVHAQSYLSRAQCAHTYSNWTVHQFNQQAFDAYAIAAYKAFIVAIQQAIDQKQKPLDKLRDNNCIDYGGDESWDLHFN